MPARLILPAMFSAGLQVSHAVAGEKLLIVQLCPSPFFTLVEMMEGCVICLFLSVGSLPGIFIIESIMDDMARSLGLDVEQVKEANFYKKGDISYLVSNDWTSSR